MAQIEREGVFENGEISFGNFKVTKDDRPVIGYVCTEDGADAWGTFWCDEDGIKKTVDTLRLLGVTGDSQREILGNAEDQLLRVPCKFRVKQKGEYFNVVAVTARNADFPQNSVTKDVFLAALGSKPVAPSMPAPTNDMVNKVDPGDNMPF